MISLTKLYDFRQIEFDKLQEACVLVNKVFSDPRFIPVILGHKFDSTVDTNDEILAKLSKDCNISNIYCENLGWWATHVSKTIAEESPDGSITFNRPFFDRQTTPSLAQTLAHEFCHCCGYSHRSSTDYDSVPYAVGALVQKFIENELQS